MPNKIKLIFNENKQKKATLNEVFSIIDYFFSKEEKEELEGSVIRTEALKTNDMPDSGTVEDSIVRLLMHHFAFQERSTAVTKAGELRTLFSREFQKSGILDRYRKLVMDSAKSAGETIPEDWRWNVFDSDEFEPADENIATWIKAERRILNQAMANAFAEIISDDSEAELDDLLEKVISRTPDKFMGILINNRGLDASVMSVWGNLRDLNTGPVDGDEESEDGNEEGEDGNEEGEDEERGQRQSLEDPDATEPYPEDGELAVPIYKYSTQERYPEDHPDEKKRGKRKEPLIKILQDKGVPQVVINTVLRNITKQLKHNNIAFTENKQLLTKLLENAILKEARVAEKSKRDFKKKHGIAMDKLPFPKPGEMEDFEAPKSKQAMILATNQNGVNRVYVKNDQGLADATQFITGNRPGSRIKPVKPGDEIPYISTKGMPGEEETTKSFGNLGDLAERGKLFPGVYEYFRQIVLARTTSAVDIPGGEARRELSGTAAGAPKGREVEIKEELSDDGIDNSIARTSSSAVEKATGPGGKALGVGTILNLNDNNWKKKFPWMKNVKYIALGPTKGDESGYADDEVKFKFFNDSKKAASWAWEGVASMKSNPERHRDFVETAVRPAPPEIQRLYQAMFLDKFDAQTGAENPSSIAPVEGKEFWRDWANSAIDALGDLSSEESELVVNSDIDNLVRAFADPETAAEEFPVDDEGKLLSGRILFANPPNDWIKYGGTSQEWTGYRVPVRSRKQKQKYRFVPGLTRKEKAAWYSLSYRVVSRALGQTRPSPSIIGVKKREIADNYTTKLDAFVKKSIGEKKNFIGMVRNRQRQMKAMDAAKKRGIQPETGTIKISPLNQQLTTISGAGLDGADSLNLKGGRVKGTPGKGASRAQRKTALDAVSKHLAPYLKKRGIKLSEHLLREISSSILENYVNYKLMTQSRDKNIKLFQESILSELNNRGLL